MCNRVSPNFKEKKFIKKCTLFVLSQFLKKLKNLLNIVMMSEAILHGLDLVTDLVTTDGQHHLKWMKKLRQHAKHTETKKSPFTSNIDAAMQVIYFIWRKMKYNVNSL